MTNSERNTCISQKILGYWTIIASFYIREGSIYIE